MAKANPDKESEISTEAAHQAQAPAEWDEQATKNRQRDWEISDLRRTFAQAILENPNVERFVYGNPLEPRRVGDSASVGAYLALTCHRLAVEFYEALYPPTSTVAAPAERSAGADPAA